MKTLRPKSVIPLRRSKRRRRANPAAPDNDLRKFSIYPPALQALTQRPTLEEFWQKHAIYDLAPIGLMAIDRAGRILQLNRQAADLLSLPAATLVNRPFLVFVSKHDVMPFVQLLINSTRNPERCNLEMELIVENRHIPVQISVMTVGHDTIIHELAILDLTQIKRTDHSLQESLAHWHSLVQNAPDTIMTLERSGKIVFVNGPFWGYSVDAITGTLIPSLIPEDERSKLQRCLTRAFKLNKRSQCEISKPDGNQKFWYMFSFGPAKGVGTERLATVLIRDITAQKANEHALQNSSDQLREFAARIDVVREEERTRLAREIHDELGQALTILKLDLSWVQGKLRDKELRKRLKAMIADVDQTIGRVRRISSDLRPSILDDLGLAAAIEWQVSQIQKRTGIRTKVISDADSAKLSPQATAAIFRVVQEALTNVVRHAQATRVQVRMTTDGDALRISIEDNGKGITDEQKNDMKSLGIVGMKERIARLFGDFMISSEPGKGTRLDIIIPL